MQYFKISSVRKRVSEIPGAITNQGGVSFLLGKRVVCHGIGVEHVMDCSKAVVTFDDFKGWPQGYLAIASAGRVVLVTGAADGDFVLSAPVQGSPFKALEEAAGFKKVKEATQEVGGKGAAAQQVDEATVLKALAGMVTEVLNGQIERRGPGRPRKVVPVA